ncbi:hypothetical protein JCM24511_01356 [Saitozyma sp. JCM 24511]|nr:hypothetical protein JCM24511_01356 [Saitozyma sp. JCM 24511]
MLSSPPFLRSVPDIAVGATRVETHLSSALVHDAADLLPLPEDKYPREVESREPDQGYYVALGLILSVWMITPLSCAYLVWYTLFGSYQGGLTATLFAAYALTEVTFAIYHHYLIRFVQSPSPPSNLPLEVRHSLFMRVLTAGLTYPIPTPPKFDSDDPLLELRQTLYNRYVVGQITAAQYHRLLDSEYEERMGMRETRRVGKMTGEEREVIAAFAEPEEREQRLREEVERDVGMLREWDEEGIVDKDGNAIRLHLHDRRAVEFRERLRTWFNHAPWTSIKRDNMLVWLCWSCFNLPLEEARANPTWSNFLDRSLELLEARTGTTFASGFDPSISIMRLTMDPVNAKGRPFILFAVSNAINWWLREVVYPFWGMGLYREGPVEYLIRIPKGWTAEKGRTQPNAMPVVYLHGLGFGLLQNHLLIKHLLKSLPTHPIVVVIAPHTSQSLFHERHLRPWNRTELVNAMKGICQKWGFWEEPQTGNGVNEADVGGVSLLSHSNGTVAHGWILKDCPSLARRNTFVDPVVFCLWEGDVCHSFCYRKPATALELLLFYFIASEVGIANYIQRHFDWADNTLFFDEIPHGTDPDRTAFFIGGKDIILDASRVRRYLERHGVTSGLHWDPEAGHGDGLAGEARDRVVMFVGTGRTRGWQEWLKAGRRRHSLGQDDWKAYQNGIGNRNSNGNGIGSPASSGMSMEPTGPEGEDSDRTLVEETKKTI